MLNVSETTTKAARKVLADGTPEENLAVEGGGSVECIADQIRELEVAGAEIRMRAERRLGELIGAQKEMVGLNAGARGIGKSGVPPKHPTLSDAGIDKKLSSRAQKLAAVPEDQFEGMLGEWRERVKHENERVTTNLLKATGTCQPARVKLCARSVR